MRDNISHTCEIVGEDVELDFISAADYSVYVEFGTSRQDAQPFFRPPLVGIEKRIKEKVEG
jgi:HK97 gp10 family phage protein